MQPVMHMMEGMSHVGGGWSPPQGWGQALLPYRALQPSNYTTFHQAHQAHQGGIGTVCTPRATDMQNEQHLVSLVVGSPVLGPKLQLWPPQSRAVGHDNHPSTAGSIQPQAAQDTIHQGNLGSLLVQLGVQQDS